MQRIVFTDGDRVIEWKVADLEAWRVVGLPDFLYDGAHDFDLNIRHPDNCDCAWAPKVIFAEADV